MVYVTGMKRFSFHLFCLLTGTALLSLLSACALVDKDKSILSPAMWEEIDRNRENLNKLRIGMTQDEVRKIMGEPMTGQVYNTEHHWFYYTRTRWSDGMATRDECTPVVFSELGLVIGIGNQFYKENYSITFWSDKSIEKAIE